MKTVPISRKLYPSAALRVKIQKDKHIRHFLQRKGVQQNKRNTLPPAASAVLPYLQAVTRPQSKILKIQKKMDQDRTSLLLLVLKLKCSFKI